MARPLQYQRQDDYTPGLASIKGFIKSVAATGRAHSLAWLCTWFDDAGERFERGSRQLARDDRRRRPLSCTHSKTEGTQFK